MKIKRIFGSQRLPQPGALVLMYHRIATAPSDPWQMAVSPAHFEEQLRMLENHYHVITVQELISLLPEGPVPPGTICLTFDDGYADNYLTALPLLEKYRCPATFFIVSGCVGSAQHFWWDLLGDLLLNTAELPEIVTMNLRGEHYTFSLDGETRLTPDLRRKHLLWHYPANPPGRRAALYLDIYERIKDLTPAEQEGAIQEIRQWRPNGGPVEAERLPVNTEQLMNMSRHPLLDIGLHTRTHPALGVQSPEQQYEEISSCREYLEQITDRLLPVISYPHGHYNKDTLRLVKEQQLQAAFTTEAEPVTKEANPYRLGRFQVGDWDGVTFNKRLSKWMGGRL